MPASSLALPPPSSAVSAGILPGHVGHCARGLNWAVAAATAGIAHERRPRGVQCLSSRAPCSRSAARPCVRAWHHHTHGLAVAGGGCSMTGAQLGSVIACDGKGGNYVLCVPGDMGG